MWMSSDLQSCAKTQTVAVTAGDRRVTAHVVGQGPAPVLITATHHANEWITGLALTSFLEQYCAAIRAGCATDVCLFLRTTLYAVPNMNPDGTALVAGLATEKEERAAREIAASYPKIPFPQGWKANLSGVDLNLNYPAAWEEVCVRKHRTPAPRDYPGGAPLDQPETRGLVDLTRSVQPVVTVALHTQGREIYADFQGVEPPGTRPLSELFAACSGYTVMKTPKEASGGGFKDWFIQELGRPGFTIEAGLGENPLPIKQYPEIYPALFGIIYGSLRWASSGRYRQESDTS